MSDLWDRCRLALRERLPRADWHRCIEKLRGWIDDDVFYLWIDRAPDDWRSIGNPAESFDRDIRETIRLVCGRPARGVHYLERPPDREKVVNGRRIPEHRARFQRSQTERNRNLLPYAMEELRHLEAHPPDLSACRTVEEKLARLEAIAIERARRRMENEPLRSLLARRARGAPPRDPPPHCRS